MTPETAIDRLFQKMDEHHAAQLAALDAIRAEVRTLGWTAAAIVLLLVIAAFLQMLALARNG